MDKCLKKTFLITGGTGYIGSHICYVLLKNGYRIVILDSNVNSSSKVIDQVLNILSDEKLDCSERFKFIKGDIRDEKILSNIFHEYKISGFPIKGVIHLAGLKSVSESLKNPLKYWEINVLGSIKLFNVMEKFDCRTIVFSSSATIYGLSNNYPITEKSTINPTNPYGATKATIENILISLAKQYTNPWKVANLRYFNPIGAHPSGQIGENPLNTPNNLFPLILEVAMGKRKQINIFGIDWDTPDGTGIRDYIHVMDLAESHVAALNYLMSEKKNLINLNIGNGKGFSVLELIKKFEEVNSCKILYQFSPRREGDISISVANNDLSRSLLNWKPTRDIEDMCRDGWKWCNKFPEGY